MAKTDKKLGTENFPQLLKRLMKSVCLSLAVLILFAQTAAALNIISDEETETFLAEITRPLFKSAGIAFNRNNIFIVNDSSLNAFVSDGNLLFINTGTIIGADSPEEISGVIAHETGHIMGGHIIRQKLKNQSLQQASLASLILAGTAAAATGRGDVAMAIALGGQSSTLNNFLQYRTEQERSADESAVKLLKATKQSPQGMLKFMKRLAKTNEMSGIEENPYFRTHPVTRERIGFLDKAVKESDYNTTISNPEKFRRVKAKLSAYLEEPKRTFRRYPSTDNSIAARYARTIAYFKQLEIKKALSEIDALIEKEPHNPFFKELKAQIYLETGKIKEAKHQYKQALDLMPASPLLQVSYAQAIMEDTPNREELQTAVKLLNKSNIVQPTATAWLLLARAYNELSDEVNSNYAAAEFSLRTGNTEAAKRQVETALAKATTNPRLSLKLNDLLNRINAEDKDFQS